MIVKLKTQARKPTDLSPRQEYVVIGIEADDLRILNDLGRPYLYPRKLFTVVDASHPSDWVLETGEDGETYAYPPAMNTPGFFEDFFEGKPKPVATFWRLVNRQLAKVG